MSARVSIVGTTTWGTTLGILLARKGISVAILSRTQEEAADLTARREHPRFLPGIPFPDTLTISSDMGALADYSDLIILAVPSDRFRQNVRTVKEHLPSDCIVLSVTKGLELPDGKRMSQVLEEELPSAFHSRICSLSGPNLAQEIVQGKPASTVVAGRNDASTSCVQEILMSPSFRVYTSSDIIGVELGGTLKNIIALGAGIADGLGVGDNGKSALITRGLAEISRLGLAAGADPLTFAGLAGLGDIVATCASPLSRNRYVGEQLAQGRSWPEIQGSMQNVAEGVNTTGAALEMADKLGVDMPIAQVTYRVLFEDLPPRQALAELMGRPPRPER